MELGCVWMSLQRNCMILGVFIEVFEVKITIGLSKNHCDLILTVGFDFSSNLTIGSSYIRWKSIYWAFIGSSFVFYKLLLLIKKSKKYSLKINLNC